MNPVKYAFSTPTDAGDPLPLPPSYATDGAAGADLFADCTYPITLAPFARAVVRTGITLEIPPGFEAQVRPRSGLALSVGVTVLNAPGTIDSDYRGEVCVLLVNTGEYYFTITHGMRIAQLVFARCERATFQHVSLADLKKTQRGDGGFGSTGND